MKKTLLISIILTTLIFMFSRCSKDELAITQGENNARMVNDALSKNDIKYAAIFSYNAFTDKWDLIADTYPTQSFNVTNTYFVLNSTKSYYNLDYLAYFYVPASTKYIELYFNFKTK